MKESNGETKIVKQKEQYDMQYVKHKRFLVEIKNEDTGQIFYSKRVCFQSDAWKIMGHYNKIRGYLARCFDTKTGEVSYCTNH